MRHTLYSGLLMIIIAVLISTVSQEKTAELVVRPVIESAESPTQLEPQEVIYKILLAPKDYLKQEADQLFDLLNRIIYAESGWKANIKNNHSTASGLFQFLDGTFQKYCIDKYKLTHGLDHKNDPYIQIDCAILMIKDGGIEHWDESKHLWSKQEIKTELSQRVINL